MLYRGTIVYVYSHYLFYTANLQTKDGWRVVVGTSGGDLYAFGEREVSTSVPKAHSGACLSLAEGGTGAGTGAGASFVVSGGKGGELKVWNQALQQISSFSLLSYATSDPTVAAIDILPSSRDSRSLSLLVGMYGGEVVEVVSSSSSASRDSAESGETRNLELTDASARVLLHSHFSGELWGLAPHPIDPDIVATAGDDGTLKIWSIRANRMLYSTKIGHAARSVAWHPSGRTGKEGNRRIRIVHYSLMRSLSANSLTLFVRTVVARTGHRCRAS